jgi:hypothetical protein
MLLTVKIFYLNGETDIKECHDIKELNLDNVESIKIIREEDEIDTTHPFRKSKCPVRNKVPNGQGDSK